MESQGTLHAISMFRSGQRSHWLCLFVLNLVWSGFISSGHAQNCVLHPIALSRASLSNAVPGETELEILNGTGPGQFGWLSWSGSPSESALVSSLSAVGNSDTYVNPDDSSDRQVSIGDWVSSKPGVSNSKMVRDVLEALKGINIMVPIWDANRGSGDKCTYCVSGFAIVRVLGFQLAQQNRITAQYIGMATCAAQNLAPTVDAGADQTLTLPASAMLAGVVTDDGLPAGSTVSVTWSQVSGPGATSFLDSHSASTMASFDSSGTYVLRLTATDSQLSAHDDLVITVNRENRAPLAYDQGVATDEDVPISVTLSGSDPDGDVLAYVIVRQPAFGMLAGEPPNVIYTSRPDYHGLDEFTFRVNDSQLDSGISTVTITNLPVNDAPVADAQSLVTPEDMLLSISLSGSDIEGDSLAYTVISVPTNGTLSGTAPNVGYIPALNFNGTDGFVFRVNDGERNSAIAEISINVVSINDTPVVDGGPDHFINQPTNTVTLAGMADDDYYFDANSLLTEWSVVEGPGTVTFGDMNAVVTTVSFNAAGIYTLRLAASDGLLDDYDEAVVTVNAGPTVNAGADQTVTYPASATLQGVAGDDGIPTNSSLAVTWSKVSGPGTVYFADSQSTNTTASFSEGGKYVLRLAAADGVLEDEDQVVIAVNKAPIVDAGLDLVITNLSTALVGTVADDGFGQLTVEWAKVSGPGGVTFSTNAPLTTGAFGISGVYTLRLTASDGLATTSDEVSVSINLPPTAHSQSVNIDEDTSTQIKLVADDDGDAVVFELVTQPEHGTLSGTAPILTYTPHTNYFGMDAFTFRVSDGTNHSATATVQIVVNPINDVPVAVGQAIATLEDIPAHLTLSGADADGGPLSFSVTTPPRHGVLIGTAPDLIYVPGTNFSGVDSFAFIAKDGITNSEMATLLIAVTTVNDPPTADAGFDQALVQSQFQGTNLLLNPGNEAALVGGNIPNWVEVVGTSWTRAAANSVGFPLSLEGATYFYPSGVASAELRQDVNCAAYAASIDAGVQAFQFKGYVRVKDEVRPDSAQIILEYRNSSNQLVLDQVVFPPSTESSGWRLCFDARKAPIGTRWIRVRLLGVRNLSDSLCDAFFDVLALNASETSMAMLSGLATDDGTPTNATLTTRWSQIAGPGQGHIVSSNTLNTGVVLPAPGHYTFQLSAHDGELSASDTMQITVQTPAGNQPPQVLAGADRSITLPTNSVVLSGIVTDDGLPTNGVLRVAWAKLSGEGDVVFDNPNALSTAAYFNQAGSYVLRLSADDGALVGSDELAVEVQCATVPVPMDVALVIDHSGSMNGSAIANAKQAAIDFVDTVIPLKDYVWFIPFEGAASVVDGPLVIRAKMKDSIASFRGGGGTAIHVGIQTAYQAITNQGRAGLATPIIILLSDGISSFTDATNAAAIAKASGIRIISIGLGGDVDDRLMKAVASSKADYYFVSDSGALPSLFERLALSICRTAYQNTPPIVEAGPGASISHPNQLVQLTGAAVEDGLPLGSALNIRWNKLTGRGEVVFGDAASLETSVCFSEPGDYVLQLTVDDSYEAASDGVRVRVGMPCQFVVDSSLVGWWTMDGTTRNSLQSAPTPSFASYYGIPKYSQGMVGTALSFEGQNEFMHSVKGTGDYDVGASAAGFTIEFWMKPRSTASTAAATVLGWTNGVRLEQYYNGGPCVRAYLAGPSALVSQPIWAITNLTWAHIALTYDRPTGVGRLYVNGVLVDTDVLGTNALGTSGDFYLGKLPDLANHYEGLLDEVSLYRRALNPQVVYEVYASGSVGKCPNDDNEPPFVFAGPDAFVADEPRTTLLQGVATDDGLPAGGALRTSWSRLSGPGTVSFGDTNALSTSATFSSNGLYALQLTADDGSIRRSDLVEVRVESLCTVEDPNGLVAWLPGNGTPEEVLSDDEGLLVSGTSFVEGKVAGAFHFDGTNDQLWLSGAAHRDIAESAAGFTIEFWMKPESTADATVLGWNNGVWLEQYYNAGPRVRTYLAGPSALVSQPIWAITNLTWAHIAITYERATSLGRLYVNGVLVDSDVVGTNVLGSGGTFYLGCMPGSGQFYRGSLDEVSLYRRPLNPQEVYEVYASGSVGKCPNDDNESPVVYAGPDAFLTGELRTAVLEGEAYDDGLPQGSSLRTCWSQFTGPGVVTFGDTNLLSTTATFSTNGIYVLQLKADDGSIQRGDLVEVRVESLCAVEDPDGLAAWLPGNGTSEDVVGGGSAELVSGTTYAEGRVAGAFSFDGSNDQLCLPGATNRDIAASAAGFTIEFWMKPGSTVNSVLLGWTNGVRVEQYYDDGPAIRTYLAGPTALVSPPVWAITNLTWAHIAVTYEQPVGVGRLYVNGVLVDSDVLGTNASATSGNFYLGAVSSMGGYYKGFLDEVSLYRRPLNPQEIYDVYHSGSVGKCPNDDNQPPVVYAGPDAFVTGELRTTVLEGEAYDDGLPQGSSLRTRWSQFSGPGGVTFGDTNLLSTTASFSTNGIYVLQLTADDGSIERSDLVEVRVESLCTIEEPDGLVAWLPGNGTAEDVLTGNDGLLAGGTSYVEGRVAGAFQFDGNNRVQLPATADHDLRSSAAGFTVEWWMKPNSTQNGYVLGWANGVRAEKYNNASGGFRVYLSGTAPNLTTSQLWTSGSLNWTHVAMTYDRASGVGRLYINGVQATSANVGTNILGTSGDFYLGQVPGSVGSYNGLLDELSLYRRPLNAQEVYEVYASGSVGKCPNDDNQPPLVYAGADFALTNLTDVTVLNGAVADDGLPAGGTLRTHWSLLAGPGAVNFGDTNALTSTATFTANGVYVLQLTADDGSIQRHDLVEVRAAAPCAVSDLVGLAAWLPGNGTGQDILSGKTGLLAGGTSYSDGKVAGAFRFDGTNDYVQLAAATNFNVGASSSGFTIELWMNPNTTQNGFVLGWTNGVRFEKFNSTAGALRVFVAGAGNLTTSTLWTSSSLNWTHVAVTYDRTAGVARIFTNGVQATSASVGTNVLTTAGNLYLGQVPGSTGFFNGLLDEVSLYARPLAAVEVQSIFAAGASGKCISPRNMPPIVSAGSDRTIYLPTNSLTLNGSAVDDGLPAGSSLTVGWSYLNGPGTVFFSSTNTPVTTITFTNTGAYTFSLNATDGQLVTNDTITVTVLPDPRVAPTIAITSPANGTALEVASNGTAHINLTAAAADADGIVTNVSFWLNDVLVGTRTSAPWGLMASNLPAAVYTLTGIAVDNSGLSATSAPVQFTTYIDRGAPFVQLFSPEDTAVITAPTNIIGTASSPILQTYTVRYRLKAPENAAPFPWATFGVGSTSVVSNTLATFDPTLLLNGIYELQVTATDTLNRTVQSEIRSVIVDRNLKIGHFTISFNDLTVPVAGLPIQIVRTYDSRAAAAGIQGDFGLGWTLDVHNVRLQKNRSLSRNWEQTTTGSPWDLSLAYHLDGGKPRIVTITFPDGRMEKFQFLPDPMQRALVPIDYPQWRFVPIGNTRGTLVPAGYDEPDGRFLYFAGSIPGTADLYDLNGYYDWINFDLTDAELARYPTLFRYTSTEGYRYLIDEIKGLQSVTDPNGNTLLVGTNGLTWTNSISEGSSVSVAFRRDSQGRITNIVDAAGHAMSYDYSTNGNLGAFSNRVGETNGFAYTNAAFPHHLTGIADARGITPLGNQYDSSGRLVANLDAFGNVVSYGHDLANNREYVTNRLGQVTASEYDEFGNVTRLIDALGAETLSAYDDNGNLLATIDPLGRTNSYTYDNLDNRLTATDQLGNTTRFTYGARRRATSVTDPLGNTVTNVFDANGNLLSMRDPLGNVTRFAYNSIGLPTAMTNALGQVMQFGYDVTGRLTNEVDSTGHATSYLRDANGNLLTQITTRTTSAGVETLAVQFQYDALSRLTNSVFPDGSSARTIYNAIGKPAATIDQQGRQTVMEYDALGRVVRTVYPDGASDSSSYDAEGRRITSTNRLGQVTRFDYDAVGRLFRTVMPDGVSTTNWFDLAGQLVVSGDAKGNHTFYGYDAAGRSVAVTNMLGQVSRSAYDAAGNLTNTVDALGRSTRFVYDALNRRVRTVFVDGTTQTTWFDALGRRTHEQDQGGKVTAFGYDTLGHMTAVTNALGYVTSYTYDELGQRLTQTDANIHTTTFEYDSLGRRTKRTLPGGQAETYAYNIGGLLTNKTDFNGFVTTYQYDLMNRLLARVPDVRRGEPSVIFGYDVLGLRTNMTDASGVTTYAYDARQRLITKVTPQGTLTYGYDANGNVTNIASLTANGARVGYEYDALNRLSAVNDPHLGRTTYQYDTAGNLQSCTTPNGVNSFYEYDSLNRLTNLASGRAMTPLANYAYTVGAAGNRLTAAETLSASVLNAHSSTINRVYQYDDLYRLTGEAINGMTNIGTLNYGYDSVGNRLSRLSTISSILSSSATFDANDRLNTDTYDASGNTLFGAGFGQSQADQYDFEHRLVTRHTAHATVSTVYDGDGNRVRKTVTTATNTVTTSYLVDDLNPTGYAQVMEELSTITSQPSTPVLSRVYAYGHNLISQARPSTISSQLSASFYGYDGHNNVRYLTDGAGMVTDSYDYDAFGNLIRAMGDTENLYLFTGEQYDLDLGLYYLRARYHNPDTGRFWTQDSFEGFGSDPTSLHKYTYCGNNPVNCLDPSGNTPLSSQVIATAISTTVRAMVVRAFLGSVAGAYVGFHVGFYDAITHGESDPDRILDHMIGGAVGGAIVGGSYGAISALPAPWSKILGTGLTAYLLGLGAQDTGTSLGEGHYVGGVFRSVLLAFGVRFTSKGLTEVYGAYYRFRAIRGGAKYARPITIQRPIQEYIYGPREDAKINPDGSTNGRTWTTPDEFNSRAQATDKLDLFKPVEGRRRVTIPAGSKVQKGVTPGREGPYNGEGGANETWTSEGLPPGSVGPFEPL
jgi:RHS repeat-associated protein